MDPPTPNNSFDASPGPVDEIHIENFETLKRAFAYERACLISAIRKSDGRQVALVCAMQHNDDDGSDTPIPFAEMLTCNPFESYTPPNPH